jgi:hypothetical protein
VTNTLRETLDATGAKYLFLAVRLEIHHLQASLFDRTAESGPRQGRQTALDVVNKSKDGGCAIGKLERSDLYVGKNQKLGLSLATFSVVGNILAIFLTRHCNYM